MKPFICTMPLRLDDGWNQVQFNLADFTRRAYGVSAPPAACCGRAATKHGLLAPTAAVLAFAPARAHRRRRLLARPPRPAQTNYVETIKVQIHANCRLRRVFFSDRLYADAEVRFREKPLEPLRGAAE